MAGGAAAPPPPRTVSAQRFAEARAGELRSLHAAVSARLGGRFRLPRASRRRTTGHLPSKRRRRDASSSSSAAAAAPSAEGEGEEGKVSRRVRRRGELASNPAIGFVAAGDGARRLRTHLWHAKRFEMGRRWGFVLPLGIHGRGRGSRAILKWLQNGALVHDSSYYTPVRLEGPEDSLLSVLRIVLHPSPPEKSAGSEYLSNQIVRGLCYENAMLWHIGHLHSHVVGPVTYMWCPFLREDRNLGPEEGDLSNVQTSSSEGECGSLQRQLWIWIHPASFEEGLDALKFACQKQMHDYGGVVSCCSLEGQIGRLEVMGAKAMQALKKALHPINEEFSTSNTFTSRNPPLDSCIGSPLQKASIIDHPEHLPPRAILSLTVHDPREVSIQETKSSPKAVSMNHEKELREEVLAPNVFTDGAPAEKGNMLSSTWLKPGKHDIFLSDCKELWTSSHQMNPPTPENILCTEKHNRRMKFFCLDSGDHQGQVTEEKDCFGQSCPIILLKHAKEGMHSTWWSIILPLSWVKPFWLSLVSQDVHAIGLRERHWVASKFNLPSFPYDYPDCKAYSSLMADEAAAFDKAAALRPAALRPPRVPVPPPWHCIAYSADKGGGILRGLESDDMQQSVTIFPESSPINSDSGGTESSSTHGVASFQVLVPRTIQLFRQYLREIDQKYLASSDMDMDSDQPNLVSGGPVKMMLSGNGLCLVRVLIRALKEGSFNDGAIVCAPVLSDLSSWKTRSEDEEEECSEKWELQLPQSYVNSYFTQSDSGNWNLGLPNDDTTRQAFRWPIGFITTGFVLGSSGRDAVAVAFCEAKLLAMLRRQQWTQLGMQKQEIFVLVRNTRSAAYRRALATVVLEHQREDLEFL